jgi:hypothetical protein
MRKLIGASLAFFALAGSARAQAPVFSDEFQVNTYTTGAQYGATVANLGPDGSFVVAWNDELGADGDGYGVRARRFDVTGAPLGAEFTVPASGANEQGIARVGSNANGDFVVTWSDIGTSPAGYYQVYARRFNATGVPQGGNIAVNTYTTGIQAGSSVALDSAGNFVVIWASAGQDGSDAGVFGQLFDNTGAKVGAEFMVNEFTTGDQRLARVARRASGEFIVVWQSLAQDGANFGVMARRYAANGTPVAGEFQVNTRTQGAQYQPAVDYSGDGSAVIVWTSYGQDGSNAGVYGQRLDAAGAKLGPEFNVNTYTTGFQGRPNVAVAPEGDFAIIWQSAGQDGSDLAIRAQHYDATGRRLGVELPVNAITSNLQGAPHVTAQPNGQYVAVWDSVGADGDDSSVAARLAGFPEVGPMLVDVPHDTFADGASNINGVLEPDEAAIVEPSFTNNSDDSLPLSGTASNLRGLPGPTYSLLDTSADYGTITSGATFDCFLSTGDCYSVMVSGARPAQHWDAAFDETLSYESFTRTAALHVGGSFADVPQNAFYPFIENLFHNGVTGGCATGYCPAQSVTRAQMAVFLLKARWGSGFIPAPATGTAFPDVPAGNPFAPWIEELVREGITAGCGGGLYCPNNPVTRQQMAIFLLKTLEGSAYLPPAGTGIFQDVTGCPNPNCNFIEELYNRGITGGCQTNPVLLYCPSNAVLRQQMAVFLVKTFGLLLYGP